MSTEHYNWQKTLSYDAPITMVCTARGKGKTFGLREQCVRDFIKNGYRFCAVVRYKSKINQVASNFFEKLQIEGKFLEYVFKVEGRKAFIAKRPENLKNRPEWQLIGYFIALTEAQDSKEMTFGSVKRLFLDEFILDPSDKNHRYLFDEYTKLVTIIDSVYRENKNSTIDPRIYLIGNALNVINPYFHAFGILDLPPKGYSWHKGKQILLHYDDDKSYSKKKAEETLAGKMYSYSSQSEQNVHNEFIVRNMENIKKKTPQSFFVYGLIWRGSKFGVWVDADSETFYVNRQIPPNRPDDTYALTLSDKELNYKVAKKNEKRIISLFDLFCEGHVFFDKESTRQMLFEIFALFGARI